MHARAIRVPWSSLARKAHGDKILRVSGEEVTVDRMQPELLTEKLYNRRKSFFKPSRNPQLRVGDT